MQKTIADTEREKAEQSLPEMLAYLSAHPARHTAFMDRWFRLCVIHGTQVYPAKPRDGAEGRVVLYGKPKRSVLCIESAARFGHKGVWFVKLVEVPLIGK